MLVKLKRPGRIDLGVETCSEVSTLLAAGSPVAFAVSGGKDSVSGALRTFRYLDEIGHAGQRVLIHADLGSVEWEDSLPTCQRLASFLGVELMVVSRPAGGMMERWEGRWANNIKRYRSLSCVKVILPWSTPSMRFCTSELKSAPMAAALVKRFPGSRIVSACGVRRNESRERKNAPTTKENERLKNARNRTTGIDWNPIAEWSAEDVFAYAAQLGFPMHEGYTQYDMSRISCMFCIMAKLDDLIASASCPGNWATYRRMVTLEILSGFAFQGSTWLGDIAPQLLSDDVRSALVGAKESAARRILVESRIPNHLLYVKGWPTVMPTRDEAILLANVRIEVASILGIEVDYTDADAVVGRYAELMAKNEARKQTPAPKRKRKVKN